MDAMFELTEVIKKGPKAEIDILKWDFHKTGNPIFGHYKWTLKVLLGSSTILNNVYPVEMSFCSLEDNGEPLAL